MIVQIRDLSNKAYSKLVAYKTERGFKKIAQALETILEEWEAYKPKDK
jgi:hypothetical protein